MGNIHTVMTTWVLNILMYTNQNRRLTYFQMHVIATWFEILPAEIGSKPNCVMLIKHGMSFSIHDHDSLFFIASLKFSMCDVSLADMN